MRHILIVCMLLCMSVGCSTSKSFTSRLNPLKTPDHDMKFDMARANETDGHLVKAEEAYRELCEAHPKVSKYHHRHGVVLMRMGQRAAAIQELEIARDLNPNDLQVLNDLGYSYLQNGDPTQATATLRKAIELDPQNKRANNNLALALGYDGDLKESFRIFQTTMPEAEALANLGYMAVQNGQTDLAIKAYSRSLTLDPEGKSAAEALTQLALLQRDMSETQSIAADLNANEKLASKSAEPSSPTVVESSPEGARKPPVKSPTNVQPVKHSAPRKPSEPQAAVSQGASKVLVSELEE